MLLSAANSQSPQSGFSRRFLDAVGLQQAAVVFSDLAGDVAIPPVGGQTVGSRVFLGGFDADVVRAFELDDVRCLPGDAGIAAALGVFEEQETHFMGSVGQSVQVADLGLDGGEVAHGLGYLI